MKQIEVSKLPECYGIVRSAMYRRIKQLGIKPFQSGRKAYITEEQLDLLSELHDFIQKGGDTANFCMEKGIEPPRSPVAETGLPNLAYFTVLEEACRNQWRLRTSEIARLLNINTEAIASEEKFSDAGFLFCKDGNRLDGEGAWKVVKP